MEYIIFVIFELYVTNCVEGGSFFTVSVPKGNCSVFGCIAQYQSTWGEFSSISVAAEIMILEN